MTKQARAEQTRLQLLEAAAELLHRDGYAATSMVDIARQAGVTKGGLYFHFTSKDDVCDEVQAAAVAVLADHVRWIDRRITAPPPSLRRLAELSRALMHWLGADPKVGASFRLAREMGAKDVRFVVFVRAWLAEVRRYVAEADEAGELSAGVLPDMASLLVVVLCVGLESVVGSGAVPADIDLERTLTELWRVIELAEPVAARRS
ncbi:ScbR family autoregulator-binding transcription factor [Amycolatopsis sp. NPDC051903]|uniref:ScbR family autoregulator-binding transcription factor n=1 Tax=Amycolatopsis sp. NPDC051903 TaxID=3363936 RepID=UPI0037B8F263